MRAFSAMQPSEGSLEAKYRPLFKAALRNKLVFGGSRCVEDTSSEGNGSICML